LDSISPLFPGEKEPLTYVTNCPSDVENLPQVGSRGTTNPVTDVQGDIGLSVGNTTMTEPSIMAVNDAAPGIPQDQYVDEDIRNLLEPLAHAYCSPASIDIYNKHKELAEKYLHVKAEIALFSQKKHDLTQTLKKLEEDEKSEESIGN